MSVTPDGSCLRRGRREGGKSCVKQITAISVTSSRDAATEKRYQGLAKPVRPSRRENHFSPGMIGLAAWRSKQIRNPPCDRGRGINPGDLPWREGDQPVQQQGKMGAGQHDRVGAHGVFAGADKTWRQLRRYLGIAHFTAT